MDSLEQIGREVQACTLCALSRSRKNAVPGEGASGAPILFIGEAPGFHENEQGRPFVGAAGRLLEELLATIGLERSDVFITNIVKCRPPGNRDPLPEEIESCKPYLERQIAILKPKVVVTLGRYSMGLFFGAQAAISKLHGKPKRIGEVTYLPMYHPAAALHQPSLRRLLEEDILRLPALLQDLEPVEALEPVPPSAGTLAEEPGEQLGLF